MRGIALLIIVLGSLPIIMAKPYVGALMWAWVSYFNPHRLTWGFTTNFPFAQLIAIVTLGAWLFSREPKWIPRNAIIILMLALGVWVSITTAFALVPDDAYKKWDQFVKVLLMSYVTFQLIQTKERIQILLWVIVFSVGFYGFKGGIFVILTGGEFKVLGPDDSSFDANNSVGVALSMILPLIRYLQLEAKSRLLYWFLMAAMFFTGISVLATYSRGAVLAVAGMIGFMWLKSKFKLVTALAAALSIAVALTVMPDKWFDRLESIQDYEQDWSSMERIKMWRFGVNVAMARPVTGGGFGVFPATDLYPRYGLRLCGPDWRLLPPATNCVIKARTAHSIYFDMIGEHGFFGFALFILLGFSGMLAGQRLIKRSAGRTDLAWVGNLAAMSQTAIVAFLIGGLFVNMTYFDLYYHILVILAATQVVVARILAEDERPVHRERPGGVPSTG